jgi:hypothetical protein
VHRTLHTTDEPGPEDGASFARAGARMNSGPAGPRGRRGIEALAVVLGLDDALEHPERLVGLPPRRLVELLRAARIVAADLEQAIALARLDGPVPEAPRSSEDQYLDPEEAAALLGVSVRFLRGRALPGRVTLGPKRVVYSKQALLKYARARQG